MINPDELLQGGKVLAEWCGEGAKPVDRQIAISRAQICEQCPENRGGKWWANTKGAIAFTILRILEYKNDTLKITVPNENKLHMCRICGCALPLKVHVPLKHILSETTRKQEAAFRKVGCWITKEQKALKR